LVGEPFPFPLPTPLPHGGNPRPPGRWGRPQPARGPCRRRPQGGAASPRARARATWGCGGGGASSGLGSGVGGTIAGARHHVAGRKGGRIGSHQRTVRIMVSGLHPRGRTAESPSPLATTTGGWDPNSKWTTLSSGTRGDRCGEKLLAGYEVAAGSDSLQGKCALQASF